MKTLAIFLLLTFQLNSQIQQDKLLHFSAGYGCATVVTGITNKHAVLYGIVSSVLIGGTKEIYDIKYGKPDVNDFIATAIGGVVGSCVIYGVKRITIKRNKLLL